MKICVIAKRIGDVPWVEGVKTFHYDMFHGKAERRGSTFSTWEPYFLDDRLEHPLCVTINAFAPPDVFKPNQAFVVSETVRKGLARFPNIRFLKVKIEKVYYYTWTVGDTSYYDTHEGSEVEDEFIAAQPHNPVYAARLPDYYEVIPQDMETAMEADPGGIIKEVSIDISDEYRTCHVSENVLRAYPLLWNRYHLCNEQVATVLLAFLDRRFFLVKWLEI